MPRPVTGKGRGGTPKPLETKRLLGNPGKRPLPNAATPGTALEVVGDIPAAPPGLEGKGLESWNRLWDAGKAHLSARADYVLMEQLCWALDEKHELRCWLAEDRMNRSWYTTANGQTVTHPSVKRTEQLDAQCTSWLAQLGFTPSDRARLGLLEVRTPDELDDFRRRQGQRAG
jgi:P27 family predicted phage terminase small subunit